MIDWANWIPTAAIGALGVVLWAKLDTIDKRVSKIMDTELRIMDVRVARIEAHLWPERGHAK